MCQCKILTKRLNEPFKICRHVKRAAVTHAHHSKRANNKTTGNSLKRAETPETFFPNPTKPNHERQGASPRAEKVHGQAGPPQDQREPRRRGDPPRLRPIHEPRPRRDHRVHQGMYDLE